MATLYTNGMIITVDQHRRVIRNGFILVQGNQIVAIDPTQALPSLTLPPNMRRVDLNRSIVIPGLINGHVHLIQSLIWVSCTIWPLEVALEGEDGYVAAKLAMAEMLKTGTTCFLEPMLPVSADLGRVTTAVQETGIRACLGTLVKVPRSTTQGILADARDRQAERMSGENAVAAHRQHHGSCNDRLHVWMAAETPRGADEAGFVAIGKASREHDIRITMHLSESFKDFKMIRRSYDVTPAQFCRNVGITGPHVVLAHMAHLDASVDLDMLQADGANIVHNPTSNAKLGDGIAPIPELLGRDINICLGTDGAPCNNAHDLFRDMHTAGIIHKGRLRDASVMPAEQVIEMATINGAKALGVDRDLGKKADFVVLTPTGLSMAPFDESRVGHGGIHPATIVVHSCTGRDVDRVVVDGREVVREGALVEIDEEQLNQDARATIRRLQQRADIQAQPAKMN
ncbi:5-methylthioadenosine/S-adenosylhomocysteine deaminase [Aspergillus ellipticus CBS 707.79]|uniref:5-methylthioadenosine/S-adenosylhomocysteine deaminase n=1 Tax=Aspergillus ellipticus CBS 707.79 TaxID=1448320 RepID=A0A319D253_9EURO|nr:5-methylthioadenosine/S-adenosylhomocysteine deaminase [Aspergillus ellipticus CBS 707.79]